MSHAPGAHRVDGAAEGFRAGGAVVLDPGHRDVRQTQGHGQRNPGLANVLFFDGGREPGRLDLVRVDPRVGHRFRERFHHEVFGVVVPTLAELRAAHTEEGDLVSDSGGHAHASPCVLVLRRGVAFQK